MTVGEKIQFYRKKIGLSQEDLGKKMLVSRQTVSLWEMDKTLPTVDNLLRLKEIFSISIDDILSATGPMEEKAKELKESYVFKYDEKDLQEFFKKSYSPFIKRTIIFTLFCVALLAMTYTNNTIIGLILGYFLCGIISHIKGFSAYKKSRKLSKKRLLESTYFYEVYEEYFVLNIFRNGEPRGTDKIYFDDIEKIEHLGQFLVLQIAGQNYIIKKDTLTPDSVLLSIDKSTPNNVETKTPNYILKIISILLFVLSLCTILGALISVSTLDAVHKPMVESMWIFYLFLPIPMASIIFGFYLKKNGCKYKKNVIVGFIMAALLCIYGSFTFIFANVYSHSDEPILNAEALLDIDIPPHSQINTQDWSNGTQSGGRDYIYYISDIYFDDAAVEEFEKDILNNKKWIAKIPSNMIGITSDFCYINASNYYIIYNKDTKEFNKLPSESGTYTFINILYNTEKNSMMLVEYQIEYTK